MQWFLNCINQFIHAALSYMLDMFTGGEQTWNTFICSALFVVKPLYVTVMTETCPLSLIGTKGDDGWRQWFPGRSVSSVFHLPGRGGHEAVIFICSTTSSSPPHQPGLRLGIQGCSTLVPVHE